MAFETLIHEWRAGEQRVDEAPGVQRESLERVVTAQLAGLRRRLGGAFTVDELSELHARGTDWMLELAQALEPDAPWTWEAKVADAAFARYLREASDFAGGRRLA